MNPDEWVFCFTFPSIDVFLPKLCEAQGENERWGMTEIKSSIFVGPWPEGVHLVKLGSSQLGSLGDWACVWCVVIFIFWIFIHVKQGLRGTGPAQVRRDKEFCTMDGTSCFHAWTMLDSNNWDYLVGYIGLWFFIFWKLWQSVLT